MAHIEKRGPQRYRARFREPGGRERSRTFTRKLDAQRWLDQVAGSMARGDYADLRRGEKVTFTELSKEWLASNPNKRQTTLVRDQGALRAHFQPALGDMPIARIQPLHVQRTVAALAGRAPRTVRTNYGVLRAVFSWAVKVDLLDRSPCRGVTLPAVGKAPKPLISLADLPRLHALAAAMPDAYRPAVYLGCPMGLRQAEAFGLTVGAVDFLRRTLSVRATINEVEGRLVAGEGKTDSSVRTISVPQWVLDMLAEHLARTGRTSPDDLVLQAPQGGPVRATNFRLRAYNPALVATGLEGLTFHRLRHSAGHMMRELGVPLEVIQHRLGHASIRTTADIYGSLPESVDRAVATRLDEALGAPAASPRPTDESERSE